jgi:hypothetical protein
MSVLVLDLVTGSCATGNIVISAKDKLQHSVSKVYKKSLK